MSLGFNVKESAIYCKKLKMTITDEDGPTVILSKSGA